MDKLCQELKKTDLGTIIPDDREIEIIVVFKEGGLQTLMIQREEKVDFIE